MKTLKNVESMYRDYKAGDIVIIDAPVSLDSIKSMVSEALADVERVIKSTTPASGSKMVVDSKKYGHGVAEESSDGYSRQMVPPESQGTRADTNARGAEEGAFDMQRQKRKEREERGETPEKGWTTKKSVSPEVASGIIETVLAIKSILKGMGKDVEVEADKQEDLKKLQEELNKEEDKKKS